MLLNNDCLNSHHPNWVLVWIFFPSLLTVSRFFLSASIACCPFISGTAAAAFGGAVATELIARWWQSQQGSSLLHQIKALAPTRGDAPRLSTQLQRRGFPPGFGVADSGSPPAPGHTAGAPRCAGPGVRAHSSR